MAEETNEERLLHRLFNQVSEHIETRWEYFTLNATERISGLAANVAGGVIILVFSLLVLFFFTFGFAWWLGDCIDSRAGGFALTGLIFIPIAMILYRWVRPFVREKIIDALLQDETPENPTKNG